MRRTLLLMAAVGVVFAGVAGSALGASSVFLCVPSTAGEAVTSGGSTGTCGAGTSSVALPSAKAEQEKLISILPHINYVAEGVDKKPTVQFSGVNLQVLNGSGLETTINGTGNLILGYDPSPGIQTGSHDLLVGGNGNAYTSYGGIIVGGHNNTITGPYASILGGAENTATGNSSTITGGHSNKAASNYSTVSGGCSNLAGSGTLAVNADCTNTTLIGDFASIAGGAGNQASAENSSVSGGKENKATGEASSVTGGGGGEASAPLASIVGGRLGKAPYRASTLLGGLEEVTETEFGVTP